MAVSLMGETICTSGDWSGMTVKGSESGSSGGSTAPSARGVASARHSHAPSRSTMKVPSAGTASPVAAAAATSGTSVRPSDTTALRAPPRSMTRTRIRVPRGTRRGGTGSSVSFARPKYAGYSARNDTSPSQPRSSTTSAAVSSAERPSETRKDVAARTGPSASDTTPSSGTVSSVSLQASPSDRRETVTA